ncbi:6-hydroxymethylpterin diphosphokinase MptE-like protein [Parachlamydia acanthamoebae]|uniref:6-hydroxymethylpterin diphosphokinase MptE-like protein n=1 Tax=Parachlamydia acanthamoebae TaxID=83552 RepID=UPI0024E25000|nr:6-hydroxymethylpterin diphosphokinase MptE-like protein [Parachlamydia acanthamoebae]
MTTRDPIFQKNLGRWAKFSPEKAKRLKDYTQRSMSIVANPNQELNALFPTGEKMVPLHSTEDAKKEAADWFKSLELEDETVLYVYGVGLGYYYQAAREWLRNNDQHYLVFFEDSLEVLHRLFETDLGTQLLSDKQVFLFYFDRVDEEDEEIDKLFTTLSFLEYKISALESYETVRKPIYQQLRAKIRYYINFKECSAIEYMNFGQFFFRNFYKNILSLPDSHLGNGLFDQFKGVPAIICGAGPSLEKNGDLIAGLKDKALILAGGTAVNTLNAKGILPHFGVQIDPNWYQMTRLIMNQCYEVPFFYRNRFYHNAFKLIHGDRLYITGSGGYEIANWFEKHLGIDETQNVSEGHNVVNFSLAIATALGCNPIIFVGLDLAYTEDKSYAGGVISHPLHDRKQHFQTKNSMDELMVRDDINGEPVHTLWKWIAESVWFARFGLSNPNLTLINATEGGIGLPGIPNKTLKEVSEEYLQNQYDLSNWIQGEIQEHPMPPTVTRENIEKVINEMRDSLEKCLWYCQALSLEFNSQAEKIKNNEEVNLDFQDDKMIANLQALNEEPGYIHLLRVFSDMYLQAFTKKIELIRIQSAEDERKANLKKAELNTMRYQFLAETARVNLSLIKKTFERILRNSSRDIKEPGEPALSKDFSGDVYTFEKGVIKIVDLELKLNIEEKLPDGSYQTQKVEYPNGQVKKEWTWRNHLLEGPSSFYSETGALLGRDWYVKGKKQGKSKWFYATGALHSIQRFKDGLEEGTQEYFYPNGQLKTHLDYRQGKLHGDVKLYFSNGQLKRELHYENGKRNGVERMWAPDGKLEIEAHFQNDQPVGISREWREDGQLSKEYAYDENSKKLYAKQWDSKGVEIASQKINRMDYFDQVAIQTDVLTQSLDNVLQQLNRFVPIVSQDKTVGLKDESAKDIQHDLEVVQKEMEHLKKVGQDMLAESGINVEGEKEQIWKTPSSKKEVEKMLDEATSRMGEEMGELMQLLHETTSLIAHKFKEAAEKKEKEDKK